MTISTELHNTIIAVGIFSIVTLSVEMVYCNFKKKRISDRLKKERSHVLFGLDRLVTENLSNDEVKLLAASMVLYLRRSEAETLPEVKTRKEQHK